MAPIMKVPFAITCLMATDSSIGLMASNTQVSGKSVYRKVLALRHWPMESNSKDSGRMESGSSGFDFCTFFILLFFY